jgi:hypothetical protein
MDYRRISEFDEEGQSFTYRCFCDTPPPLASIWKILSMMNWTFQRSFPAM